MKNFLFLLIFFSFWACRSENKPKISHFIFPNTTYTKVVAYHFEDTETGENIVNKAGELNPTVKKEQELNPAQVKNFLTLINNPDTYGGEAMRCFQPRLGLVFYNAHNKAAAHISICFQCNNFSATPNIARQEDMPNGSRAFSEHGRQQLVAFCKSLDFGQCGSLE